MTDRMTDEKREVEKEFHRLIDLGWSPHQADLQAAANVQRRKTLELIRWRRKHG